jgi:hypothetical protein
MFNKTKMFNIAQAQRNMNDLKPVTVEIARILLRSGWTTIKRAIELAEGDWRLGTHPLGQALPGKAARENVQGHLQWHLNTLASAEYANAAPHTIYAPGDDLKKWTMQAYIEANAVDEGRSVFEQAWNAMWEEIREALRKIPVAVLATTGSLASSVIESVTGVPLWAWLLGGLTALAGGGYLVYRLKRK